MLLLEGPESQWALPGCPDHMENAFSSGLYQKIPKSCHGPAIPKSAANRNADFSWEHGKESRQTGGVEPSWLRCCSCSASRASFEAVKEPAQQKVQSHLHVLAKVHSSILGATVFCL